MEQIAQTETDLGARPLQPVVQLWEAVDGFGAHGKRAVGAHRKAGGKDGQDKTAPKCQFSEAQLGFVATLVVEGFTVEDAEPRRNDGRS